MNETNNISLSSNSLLKPTNENITINIIPNVSVSHYTYTVYKDEEVLRTVEVKSLKSANVTFDSTGNYKIEVKSYDYNENETILSSGIYKIDKEKPILSVGKERLDMSLGSKLNILGDVKATDDISGDITGVVTTNIQELDFNTEGLKKLTYTVSDEAGNVTSKSVYINVKDNQYLFPFQLGIVIILSFIAILIVKYNKSIKLEKRVGKYSIDPIKDNSISLFDNIMSAFNKLVSKISKSLEKSVFITKYSKRYEKYINTINKSHTSGLDFVATKFIIGIFFLVIAIFSRAIQLRILSIYEFCFPIILGFFIPDIIYALKYRSYRKQIRNDLLQAITIMNNAFKSGRSIIQAIELVADEMKGPIADEFKKMYLEMTFGLEVHIVFKRLSERIKLEEVTYLTASLAILNRTGGNIVKVFDSIEQTLFNKKKLKLELESLTGSSKMLSIILFFVPIVFVVFISIIDPTYFLAFFTNPFGMILLVIMIMYYIIYIICVKKIMKVRM